MKLAEINESDIILLCGVYGAGKSEFSEQYLSKSGRMRISRTELRKHLYTMTNYGKEWTADEYNEDEEVLIKHIERKIFEHYLHKKKKILIINTFITRKSRKNFVETAKSMNKSISAIFLDTNLDECIQRNNEKVTGVSESIIRKLHLMKELPSANEGFTYVASMSNFREQKKKPPEETGLVEVPQDDDE